jgi:N-formylglutamate amidohydrolase
MMRHTACALFFLLSLAACNEGGGSSGSGGSAASSGGGGASATSSAGGGGSAANSAGGGGSAASSAGGSGGALDPANYLTIEAGALPLVLSAPHGGEKAIPGVPVRTSPDAVTDLDYATHELTTGIQAELFSRTGKKAYLVAALASRKYIDFNRAPAEAYESPVAAPIYEAYQAALGSAVAAAKAAGGAAALLVDVHGQSADVTLVFRGTREGQTAKLPALYATPKGFLTLLLGGGVKVSPATAQSAEDPDFNGGYIVATYGLKSPAGIDAVQLEFGYDYRKSVKVVKGTASKVTDALIGHLQANGAL